MAQIFISYTKADRDVASQLAGRLTELGYDVWWDAALLGGSRFEQEITYVLERASLAIVLWSKTSIQSEWVRAEADLARQKDTVFPILIDSLESDELPILFRQRHFFRLEPWDGSATSPEFKAIAESIAARLGTSIGPVVSPAKAREKLGQAADEAAIWADLVQATDVTEEDYRRYLERFAPSPRFGEIAKARMERMARQRRRRRSLVATGIVASLIVLAAWVSTTFLNVGSFNQACLDNPVDVPLVAFSTCVELGRLEPDQDTALLATDRQFSTADDAFTVVLRGFTNYMEPSAFQDRKEAALATLPTTVEGSILFLRTWTETINGHLWTILEYERRRPSDVEQSLTFYGGSPESGAVEITAWGYSRREPLMAIARPIVEAGKFR